MIGTRTGSATARGWLIQASLRVVCIGTLRAAENGLVTVSAASCSSVTDGILCRYHWTPIGNTKRTRSVR